MSDSSGRADSSLCVGEKMTNLPVQVEPPGGFDPSKAVPCIPALTKWRSQAHCIAGSLMTSHVFAACPLMRITAQKEMRHA